MTAEEFTAKLNATASLVEAWRIKEIDFDFVASVIVARDSFFVSIRNKGNLPYKHIGDLFEYSNRYDLLKINSFTRWHKHDTPTITFTVELTDDQHAIFAQEKSCF